MGKIFLLNEQVQPLSAGEIAEMEKSKIRLQKQSESFKNELNDSQKRELPPLKHVPGRVIIQMDLEGKNWHTFSDGQKIRIERQFENLNRRETEPVNCIVVSAENIPSGVEILVHPNAATETNLIHNVKKLSGEVADSDIRYYSILEEQCFIWKGEDGNWNPLPPYETALRVYKPYEGVFEGIEPTLVKDTLYITSGNMKGFVVTTIKAVDYCVVFMDSNGVEGNIIRFRPNGDERTQRESEAIAILHEETERVKSGKLLVGITPKDAKPLSVSVN